MDDKGKKTLYNVFGALLGIGLMISLTAAIYGHLWLSEFEGPASDLAVIISDDVAAEKSRMEDVRLFGAVFSVVGLSLIIAITPGYNQLLDSPRWQTKKSLGIGLLMILGGSLFYFFEWRFNVRSNWFGTHWVWSIQRGS